MSVRTIGTATAVGGNSLDGGSTTGPYFPTREVANIINVNLYDYTAANGLRFNDGAEVVVGKPVQSAPGTLTTLNAPFIWDATAFSGTGGYVENENSIVASNADGTLVGVEERVTIVISGNNPSNETLFAGDDTCRPVFYGVDFVLDGYSNANVLGVAITGANVEAAPQFYDCRVFHTNTNGVHRYQAFNYLIRGLQLISTNDNGAVYEAGAPPKVPAIGLSFIVPNFLTWGNRAALAFVNAAGGDAANRYVTNGLAAPAFPLYRGNAGAQVSPNRGAIHVNPVPSPVPWTLTTAAGNTDDVIPFLSFRTVDVDHVLGGGSSMEAQRVAFTFDQAGYTLRVRRAEVEVWNWRDTEPVNVQYAGLTKASNGSLTRLTSSGANNTTPRMVDGQPTVEDNTTQNLSYVDSDQVDNVVFQGYDVTVAGTDTVITLPVSHQIQIGGASGSNNNDTVVKFYRWEIWAIHPQRGITQVMEYDFTPENQNANHGTGTDIEVNVVTPLDPLYTSDRDVTTAGAITDGAYLHDAAKKYQVVRADATAYSATHINSDVPIVTSTGTLTDFGDRQVTLDTTTGNRVVSSSDDSSATAGITLKPASTGIINTVHTDGSITQKATGFTTTAAVDVGSVPLAYYTIESDAAVSNVGASANVNISGTVVTSNNSVSDSEVSATTSYTPTGSGQISSTTITSSSINSLTATKLGDGNTYDAGDAASESLAQYLARAVAAGSSLTQPIAGGLNNSAFFIGDAGINNVTDWTDVTRIAAGSGNVDGQAIVDATGTGDAVWLIQDADNWGRAVVDGDLAGLGDTVDISMMDFAGTIDNDGDITVIIDGTNFVADDANNLKDANGSLTGQAHLMINFVAPPATINAIDLLSAGGGYNTDGDVTLTSTTATTVTVTADDVGKLNIPGIVQGGPNVVVGNITYVYPATPIEETYTISAIRNGRYAVKQTKGGTETVLQAPADLASGTNITINVGENGSAATNVGFTTGDSVKIYLKYDSDVPNQDIYQERIFTFNFGDGSQVAELIPIDPVLIGSISVSSGGTFSFPVDTGQKRFLRVAGRTTLPENQNESQGFASVIANSDDHFDAWYNNDTGIPLGSYGVGSFFWDTDVITGISGDTGDESLPGAGGSGTVTANVTRSQIMTRWFKNVNSSSASTLFRNVTGPEWTILNSGNPPLGDVVTAVDISLNTNDKVDDIQRVSGYIAANQNSKIPPRKAFDKDDDTNLTPFE